MESAVLALGIELLGGDEYEVKGRCPRHVERTGREDRNPSWSVNRSSGLFGCWSCGYSGNFLFLVMDLKYKNDAFKAARWIRQFGIDLEASVESLRVWEDRREAHVFTPDLDLAGRYQSYIAPPEWALKERHLTAESCQMYGVKWDPAKDAWITPIKDADAKLIGWQIKAQHGRLFRNFPNGVRKGQTVFGLELLSPAISAVVLESPLDAVRLHSAGFTGGVATYGAVWTDAQLRLISEAASEMILAFDNDDAGRKATHLAIHGDKTHRAWARSCPTWVVQYDGDAKDLGDMDDASIARTVSEPMHWSQTLVLA